MKLTKMKIPDLKAHGVKTDMLEDVENYMNPRQVTKRDIIVRYYTIYAWAYGSSWSLSHEFGVWAYLAHRLRQTSYGVLRDYARKLSTSKFNYVNREQHIISGKLVRNLTIDGNSISHNVWKTVCKYPYSDFGKETLDLFIYTNVLLNDDLVNSLVNVFNKPEDIRIKLLNRVIKRRKYLVLNHRHYKTNKDKPLVRLCRYARINGQIYILGFGMYNTFKDFVKSVKKDWKIVNTKEELLGG